MANSPTWERYKKKVKSKLKNHDSAHRIFERNAVEMGRVAPTTYALLKLLIKKKVLTAKEVKKIVDEELKKELKALK